MTQIKIEFIKITDKNKDGIPYITKGGKYPGKPFKRVAIKPFDHTEWISNNIFRNDDPSLNWKPGDTVEVIISQNTAANGTVFTNFRVPSQEDMIKSENEFLKQKLARLEAGNKPDKEYPPVIGANPSIKEDLMPIDADQVPF